MGTTSGNLALSNFNATQPEREYIHHVSLEELHPPEFHPFQVKDDLAMARLVKSVAQYGVREPGLARPRMEGGFELVAGNRRKRACEFAKLSTMPVLIRDMDDDSAAIAMVDSNLEQRESLLPSEKAWAYRVKLEALNHSGVKGDMLSVNVLAEQTGESKNQIFRYIRLTELVPDLIDKVDAKQLAFNPAVELSYLSRSEQAEVVYAMGKYEIKPSLSQAQRLKKIKLAGKLTAAAIDIVLSHYKDEPERNITISRFSDFFPASYTPHQMESVIVNLLGEWQKKQARVLRLR